MQPAPAKLTPPAPMPSGKRDIVIAIDAGHGGEDPGALVAGQRRQYEKHVTLAIAKELQRQINAEKGYPAELVRTGDYFHSAAQTHRDRPQEGRRPVCFHPCRCCATGGGLRCVGVCPVGSRRHLGNRALAGRCSENQSDLIGGAGNVSLDDKDKMLAGVLLDLSMTASLSSSLNVGNKVLGNMGRVTPLHKRRVEQAGFMVLKSPDIPSILVETGFISNPNEATQAGHPQPSAELGALDPERRAAVLPAKPAAGHLRRLAARLGQDCPWAARACGHAPAKAWR